MNERRTHLIAYDIRGPRRLMRVYKALSEVGYRIQYSVFAVDLDDRARARLADQVRRLIDRSEDDVRFYLVPGKPRGAWQGPLPDAAVTISGSPAAAFAERLARRCDNA
jgi:CRISPR-associated endonuclease Cas2